MIYASSLSKQLEGHSCRRRHFLISLCPDLFFGCCALLKGGGGRESNGSPCKDPSLPPQQARFKKFDRWAASRLRFLSSSPRPLFFPPRSPGSRLACACLSCLTGCCWLEIYCAISCNNILSIGLDHILFSCFTSAGYCISIF